MKKLFSTILAVSILSQITFAQGQSNTTTSELPKVQESKSKGIEVGLVYSNLTDVNLKVDYKTNFYGTQIQTSDTSKGGTHLGIMGLNVNYKDKHVAGMFGYYFGASLMKSINKSEVGDSDLFVYKTQGGVSLSPTQYLTFSTDLNISYLDFKSTTSDVKVNPAAGLDILADFSTQNNMSFQVGYQVLGYSAESKSQDTKITGFVSGIITQVSYLF